MNQPVPPLMAAALRILGELRATGPVPASGAQCQGCPWCQAVARLREVNPILADQLSQVLQVAGASFLNPGTVLAGGSFDAERFLDVWGEEGQPTQVIHRDPVETIEVVLDVRREEGELSPWT